MLIEKNGIKLLESKELGGARHAFFTRRGGVSAPPFDSLNFDKRGKNETEVRNVARNKALAAAATGISLENLFTPNQIHGNEVIILTEGKDPAHDADAVVTALEGLPIGILTADCLPLLFYDPVKQIIGAAHAGWKGTALSIATKTIDAMASSFGSAPGDIRAAIGPHIGPCCYPVGENVFEEFKKAFIWHEECFENIGSTLRLDLGIANRLQLLSSGIREENIGTEARCTACSEGLFFSHRKENGVTGRQLSVIMKG